MSNQPNGSFTSSVEKDFYYFDMLPRRLRDYINVYPRKLASYPIVSHYFSFKEFSPFTDDEIIDKLIEQLEEKKETKNEQV